MNRRTKRIVRLTFTHLFIVALGLIMLYPILWMVVGAFKPNSIIFSDPHLIPRALFSDDPEVRASVFTTANFVSGWKGYAATSFGKFFLNSLYICAVSVAANLISCTMAAYAFGRLKFAFKGLWFAVMMITLMLPYHVTTVPRYLMFNDLGWVGSALPIVIPKFFAVDAFFVFLLVQFIRGLPKDLDEAATIDGCGKFGIFARIIIPLAGPAMVTTALFTFLWTWDDFFNPLLFLSNPKTYTVSLGLRSFVGDAGSVSNWGGVLAMSTLALIPCFILFFSLQKYFVQGIATTGIKG
jgi:multiple sugar transport system permease protein